MSEEKTQQHLNITLPVEWHVPEHIHGRYVQNVIVQPGKYELAIFCFENRVPPFIGNAPEEVRDFLVSQGPIRSECFCKMIVDPEFLPEMIKALQTGLEHYNAAKVSEEREDK